MSSSSRLSSTSSSLLSDYIQEIVEAEELIHTLERALRRERLRSAAATRAATSATRAAALHADAAAALGARAERLGQRVERVREERNTARTQLATVSATATALAAENAVLRRELSATAALATASHAAAIEEPEKKKTKMEREEKSTRLRKFSSLPRLSLSEGFLSRLIGRHQSKGAELMKSSSSSSTGITTASQDLYDDVYDGSN